MVFTLELNKNLDDKVIETLATSLDSLEARARGEPRDDDAYTAKSRICAEAADQHAQLSTLLADPYDGDESSAMQPLIRRLLDAVNALVRPVVHHFQAAVPVASSNNVDANNVGPGGRWWNESGPCENVRPDFVGMNAVVDAKVSVAKLAEALVSLGNAPHGVQLKITSAKADPIEIGNVAVCPLDGVKCRLQASTSYLVQASDHSYPP